MWHCDDIVSAHEFMPRKIADIAAKFFRVECSQERFGVDNFVASEVDKARAGAHGIEDFVVDESARCLDCRQVERNKIRAGDKGAEILDAFDLAWKAPSGLDRECRIKAIDLHA